MKLHFLTTFIVTLTALLPSTWATEVIIPVSADATSIEVNGAITNAGSGTSVQLNGRFAATVNEAMVLKFDLSTVANRSSINAALLSLTNFRTNTVRTLHYWGVIDGAVPRDSTVIPALDGTITDNTWTEADFRWTMIPGLDYDALATTPGPISARLVDLGAQSMNNASEGSQCTYNAAALMTFLKTHPDSTVMILLTVDTVSTGQSRFASREAVLLASGTTAQPAGTFAPRLILDVANATPPEVAWGPITTNGNTLSFSVNSVSGFLYQLKVSDSLTSVSWQNLGSPVAGNGSPISLGDNTATQQRRFYRVEATAP